MALEWDIIQKLMNSFQNSFIHQNLEFIAHRYANEYFGLSDCQSEFDVKCKVLEWLSRAAFKTEPYPTIYKNERFHAFMLAGINSFLGTEFTAGDMAQIYTHLGNACNHKKTIRFIESGYDMSVLSAREATP